MELLLEQSQIKFSSNTHKYELMEIQMDDSQELVFHGLSPCRIRALRYLQNHVIGMKLLYNRSSVPFSKQLSVYKN